MQRQHYASGAQLHSVCDRRQRRTSHGGVRIQTAKLMKVPLRRPHRLVAMLIRVTRSLQQQPITLATRAITIVITMAVAMAIATGGRRKVEEAEIQFPALSLFPLDAAALTRRCLLHLLGQLES